MIKVFLFLLCSGLISVSYRNIRFQKILSFINILFLSSLIYWLLQGWHHQVFESTSYSWLTSRYYPVDIDFPATQKICLYFLVLLFTTLLSVIYMIGDTIEEQKVYTFALTCFSLAAFLLLICGQNTIQILVSSCFLDIIGFCLINDTPARKRYIFYNLFADMALFMACAILWGSCRTNIISKLAMCHYENKEFALWLITFVSIVKIGLFPCQAYLFPITDLSQSRRNILCFLSTPTAGLFILYKTIPLLTSLPDILTLCYYLSIASIIWGGIGAICIKKLEYKQLYLNLIFYGMTCGLIFNNNGELPTHLGYLFIIHFCLNNSLNTSKYFFGLSIIPSIILISAFILIAETFDNPSLIFIYLTALILATGSYIYSLSSVERKNNYLYKILPAMICSLWIIYKIPSVPPVLYHWLMAYLLLIILRPYRFLSSIYNSENIQQADGFSATLYFLFASPILFLGRVLWLTVDFLIIERTFLSSLAKLKNILEITFTWLHKKVIFSTFLFWIIGLIIIIYCSYGRP